MGTGSEVLRREYSILSVPLFGCLSAALRRSADE
jgi:hypothetical protein